jgi:hypothetical protein
MEEKVVAQLCKKFLSFYGYRRLLIEKNPLQGPTLRLRNRIHILTTHTSLKPILIRLILLSTHTLVNFQKLRPSLIQNLLLTVKENSV